MTSADTRLRVVKLIHTIAWAFFASCVVLILVTFNARDFAGVEQFGISVCSPGKFLALLEEDTI